MMRFEDVQHLTEDDHQRPDILYHGTSLRSLCSILTKDALYFPTCFTPDVRVAAYWGRISKVRDGGFYDGKIEDDLRDLELELEARFLMKGGILVIDRDALERVATPELFSDPIWGEGGCDWEQEHRVETPIRGPIANGIVAGVLVNERDIEEFLDAAESRIGGDWIGMARKALETLPQAEIPEFATGRKPTPTQGMRM